MKKTQNNPQNQAKQKGIGFFENLDKTLSSQQSADFAQHLGLEAVEKKAKHFFERKKVEEKTIWTSAQQETQFQIQTIQEELKKLAHEVVGLNQEIKTAAVEAIVDPGTYHLNFLKRILKSVSLVRQKVQESKNWLCEWNSYCKKKRNHYWTQAKKSGTKFTLSSERYMATQAG